MNKLKVIDINNTYLHGLSGFLRGMIPNEKRQIDDGLKRLESVLTHGILSREKICNIYGPIIKHEHPYIGISANWNDDQYISISKKTPYVYDKDKDSFSSYIDRGSISIALNEDVLDLPQRQGSFHKMIGEIQIKDKIPFRMFKGIALPMHFTDKSYEYIFTKINQIQKKLSTQLPLVLSTDLKSYHPDLEKKLVEMGRIEY